MDPEIKIRARAILFRCAVRGSFVTYNQFYRLMNPGEEMGSPFPYRVHFNAIAEEERGFGYPDITFMVRGVNGFPLQVDFRPVSTFGPDADQLKSLIEGTDKLIELYCPPTKNPYRR